MHNIIKLGKPMKRLMALQQRISLDLNRDQVGRTLDVLVEGQGDDLSVLDPQPGVSLAALRCLVGVEDPPDAS